MMERDKEKSFLDVDFIIEQLIGSHVAHGDAEENCSAKIGNKDPTGGGAGAGAESRKRKSKVSYST